MGVWTYRLSLLIPFGWPFTGGIQIDLLRFDDHVDGPAAGSFRYRGISGQSFENDDLLLPVFTVNSTFDAFTWATTAAA